MAYDKIQYRPNPRFHAGGVSVYFGSSHDSRIVYDAANDKLTVQTKDSGGVFKDRLGIGANADTPSLDLGDGYVRWTAGSPVVAADYSIGRDAIGAGQLHFNAPAGAGFEFSLSGTAEIRYTSGMLAFQQATGLSTAAGDLTLSPVGYLVLRDGMNLIGDAENSKMSVGLTINQGVNDDEALALKSADIAHGVTDHAETDTYGQLQKQHSTLGGLHVRSFGSGVLGGSWSAVYASDTTAKSGAANAAYIIDVKKKSGTGFGSPGADANLVAIRSNGVNRFIFDADGDSHQDVGTTWTNFDEFDDPVL